MVPFLFFVTSCARKPARIPLPTGQNAQIFPAKPGRTLNSKYLLYLPEEVNQKKKQRWPLILYLHGGSLRGENIDRVKSYGLPHRLEQQKDFPFIVVSPQCSSNQTWMDPEALIQLLDEVEKRYPVDPSRVYLTGISMGGGGAWLLASRHPERFAAVAPLCGPAQTAWACGLRDLPVRVYHGKKDTTIPFRRSEEMVKALRECHGQGELILLPTAGHDLSWLYDRNEIFDWFLSHRKPSRD